MLHKQAAKDLRILSTLVLCLFCALPATCQDTVTVAGRVRTDTGQTIPFGVTVRLETGEGIFVGERPANSNGEFEFEGVRKTLHRLTVTGEGFQPAERDLDVGFAATRMDVYIYLTTLNKTRIDRASLPGLTDEAAPKNARKEYEGGLKALRRHDLASAQTHFKKAVEEYPCYARAQADLAFVLKSVRLFVGAEEALRKAIACDPGFADAYTELGWFLNSRKRYSESAAILQEGLRRAPAAWQFYYQLGAAYMGLGQYEKAEEGFLKARSMAATPLPDLNVKLADVYLKEGAFDKAYAELEQYLQANPEGRFATKTREVMKRLVTSGLLTAAQGQTVPHQPEKP